MATWAQLNHPLISYPGRLDYSTSRTVSHPIVTLEFTGWYVRIQDLYCAVGGNEVGVTRQWLPVCRRQTGGEFHLINRPGGCAPGESNGSRRAGAADRDTAPKTIRGGTAVPRRSIEGIKVKGVGHPVAIRIDRLAEPQGPVGLDGLTVQHQHSN